MQDPDVIREKKNEGEEEEEKAAVDQKEQGDAEAGNKKEECDGETEAAGTAEDEVKTEPKDLVPDVKAEQQEKGVKGGDKAKESSPPPYTMEEISVQVPKNDYILGLADLTGKITRAEIYSCFLCMNFPWKPGTGARSKSAVLNSKFSTTGKCIRSRWWLFIMTEFII